MFEDMRIDFTDVEGQKDFTPIPPSKQNMIVSDWEAGEVTGEQSKNKGAAKLTIEFTVVDGEFEGRRIWDTFTIVENSLWKLKAFLGAIGEDVSGELSIEPEQYLGRNLVVKLGIQPKRGDYEARNKVQAYYPADESESAGSLLP